MSAALPDQLDVSQLIPCPEALACLPVASAESLGVLPIAICQTMQGNELVLVCAGASDTVRQERVAKHVDPRLQLRFIDCQAGELNLAIAEHYRSRPSLQTLLTRVHAHHGAGANTVSDSDYPAELVNGLIRQAACMRASDIHLSPEADSIEVRFRVDGVLWHQASVHKSWLNALLVRIKIMASLDIAETRYPQDGQFRRIIDASPIDFRISTFPTVAGENTVLRLIDNTLQLDTLQALKLPCSLLNRLSALVQHPDGLIVVCGPTGAGKSTTLFALLDQINHGSVSIMTLEDPVEHRVPGIRQTTIDAARQWGYAQGLRALLRQDPDVLLIGEIRDAESCEMALRAVSTGHQILTTVHASCAHSALHRLRQLNAGGAALGEGLLAIVAQRLIRKICPRCDAAGVACNTCHGTGFSGRQVVMELLEISSCIKALLLADADISEIRKISTNAGFTGMREQALIMANNGDTCHSEVDRVFGTRELY